MDQLNDQEPPRAGGVRKPSHNSMVSSESHTETNTPASSASISLTPSSESSSSSSGIPSPDRFQGDDGRSGVFRHDHVRVRSVSDESDVVQHGEEQERPSKMRRT